MDGDWTHTNKIPSFLNKKLDRAGWETEIEEYKFLGRAAPPPPMKWHNGGIADLGTRTLSPSFKETHFNILPLLHRGAPWKIRGL